MLHPTTNNSSASGSRPGTSMRSSSYSVGMKLPSHGQAVSGAGPGNSLQDSFTKGSWAR